ncbi:hypothetical protein GSI_12304 [Ganoderma sinense ZZ0214-1]|uniref:SWIM-type domain-containing protein n=1 Tax=Ganoderma sinense ZZ0214-1 TaxID=1077348 RepID=A0A2G8RYF3_9APHY|nr:hypothetical protein GSI_12304 [Ganoderma sinense ZZ0214-1]
MMVESLWRNLKRLVLIMHNRPRIDFTIHSIITQTIPAYPVTLSKIVNDSRDGRAAAPTHMQAAFKASWERLLKVPVKGAYKTSTAKWTCDCGAQKYHAYLLCKHLVQAADRPPPTWWTSLVRYHIPPFYTVPTKGTVASPPEDRTKHAWVKRMPSFTHPKPEPSDAPSPLPPSSPPSSPGPAPDDEISRMGTPEPAENEVIDLTMLQSSSPIQSSPQKAPPTGKDGLMRSQTGGDIGFEPENARDLEKAELVRRLRKAADILEEQEDPRFIQNAKAVTKRVSDWVGEIELHENRRTMPTTNRRSASSTIGYKYASK